MNALLIILSIIALIVVIVLGGIFTYIIYDSSTEDDHVAPSMLCWGVFLVCWSFLVIMVYRWITL